MSWSRETIHRRGYHHGNLREALIAAALELIATKGPAGFTFAEAARSAGVSPAAPYRHFRGPRRADGRCGPARLRALREALEVAWNEGRPDPFGVRAPGAGLSGLRPAETAYLLGHVQVPASARHQPASWRGRGPRVRRCCGKPPKRSCHAAAERQATARPHGRPARVAGRHGIASLFARGDAGRRSSRWRQMSCWRREPGLASRS